MKNIRLLPIMMPKTSKLWLLGIAVGLIAIHLNLILRRVEEPGNINLLGTSLLSWAALLLLLWRRETLCIKSDVLSSFLGTALIALVMLSSAGMHNYVPFLRIFPLISAVGIGLFAFSIKGLKQYWQELIVLCILAIPESVTTLLVGLPLITAKFATLVLLQLGFDVSQQGVNLILPTGAIEVNHGCSGAVAMLQLLRLSLLFLIIFPTNLSQKILVKILVSLVAVLLAFIVNGFRVALLAIMVASFNEKAFEYWHVGEGSHIFSMTSVLIFGLFCYYLLPQDELKNQRAK